MAFLVVPFSISNQSCTFQAPVSTQIILQYCSNVTLHSLALENANALTIADQRSVALGLLVSIHPSRNEINTRERNGYHAPLIGDYSSTRNRLTRECATLHLSSTVSMFIACYLQYTIVSGLMIVST